MRNICTATTATLLLSTVAHRGMSHCYSPYEERKKRLNDFWVKLQSEILKFNAMICAIQLHLLDCERVFLVLTRSVCVCLGSLQDRENTIPSNKVEPSNTIEKKECKGQCGVCRDVGSL